MSLYFNQILKLSVDFLLLLILSDYYSQVDPAMAEASAVAVAAVAAAAAAATGGDRK